jgi:hypothetical protein
MAGTGTSSKTESLPIINQSKTAQIYCYFFISIVFSIMAKKISFERDDKEGRQNQENHDVSFGEA